MRACLEWMRLQTPRLVVAALLLVPVVTFAFDRYPQGFSAPPGAGIVERVIDTPAMVFGARLLALYVGVFVLASILARLWNGEWLRKAGPFEVSDEVQTLKQEAEHLLTRARIAEESVESFKKAARASDEVILRLSQELRGRRRGLGRFRSSRTSGN